MPKKNPKLTIGMAHFKDFNGVYFTVQALRLYHGQFLKDCELIVVDNSPADEQGKLVKECVEYNFSIGFANTIYEPMVEPVGTSPSRNRIFELASGDFVMVVDCHILFWPDSIRRLLEYYEEKPNTNDLIQGPLVFDDYYSFVTHFDDTWRSQMWGIWGSARKCGCGSNGVMFSLNQDQNKKTIAREIKPGWHPIDSCPFCGAKVPYIDWDGHEPIFDQHNYKRVAVSNDAPPFEIPGQGLGLFSCRREAWPGFHPEARGFGGEEIYIHGKFRARGDRALCLPFLKWVHRFGRPGGTPYAAALWDKIRNYVLEFQEMDWDLAPVYEHFVEGGLLKKDQWEYLLENPVEHTSMKKENEEGCGSCGKKKEKLKSIQQAFNSISRIQRDLDQHMPTLKQYAEQVDGIVEFSNRRESTIALLAGKPKSFLSYNTEKDGVVKECEELAVKEGIDFRSYQRSSRAVRGDTFQGADLIFIDSEHTYGMLLHELKEFGTKARRYIIMHDTREFGFRGEDGGIGLLPAIRKFMEEHPEWSVLKHIHEQHGLMILGCQDKDKPKLPSTIQMAKNFTKAMSDYYATGAQKTSKELLQCRLEVCTICDKRKDNRCTECGCPVEKKASHKREECPLGLWREHCGTEQVQGETNEE